MQQRQHFIPRFILRKFASENQPPASPSKFLDEGNRNQKTRKTRRDFLVNKLDLNQATLTQRPISTECALVNMYRDPGFDADPNHLEKKLAKLENHASDILKRACDAFLQKKTLELKRSEKETLRKFLFMMKYRNAGFFHRYDHDRADDYNEDDREAMMEYMNHKGFTKPRDVWFDNLRGLLDLNMDAGGVWMHDVQAQIYPDDAKMFISHIQGNFMAFCEPMSSDEEFLLTQNAYCVFEGPSNPTLDLPSGSVRPGTYIEHHNFAPVSPRLIIVLQSNLLRPQSADGVPPCVSQMWKEISSKMRSRLLYPDTAGSILQDIPINRSEAFYTSARDANWIPREDDMFIFNCFKLPSAHVSIINNILLEEAYTTSSIIYRSATFLRTSLERYLQDTTPGMKDLIWHPLEKRRPYLMTLRKIVRDLRGSTKCHPVTVLPEIHMAEYVAQEVGIQLLQLDPESSLYTWVYPLIKQGMLRHLRGRHNPEVELTPNLLQERAGTIGTISSKRAE